MFTSIKTNFFDRLSLVLFYFPYFVDRNSTDIEKILISIDNKGTHCRKRSKIIRSMPSLLGPVIVSHSACCFLFLQMSTFFFDVSFGKRFALFQRRIIKERA